MMNRWFWRQLRGLVLVGFLFAPLVSVLGVELDGIVAVVNDDVISRSELDRHLNHLLRQQREKGGEVPPRALIEKQVLELMINNQLQLQVAQRAGITVDDQLLNRAIQNIAQGNNLSLAELRQAVEAGGLDFAYFREQVRKEIIVTRLRNQEVVERINVTDQEIDNFLAKEAGSLGGQSEYHLAQILIATPEGGTPIQLKEAKRKADSLAAQLRSGGDFAQVAVLHSKDRNALQGGDLGWIKANKLPSLLVDVVPKMKTGEVSEPIESPSGYHIIKVIEIKGGTHQVVKQTKVRHILVITNEVTSDRDAQTRLAQLKQRIDNGEDFAGLARSHSDDKASAMKGGELGWVSHGDLTPKFEEEMELLSPGSTSEPFRTEYGWHILQVQERRNYDNSGEALRTQAREAIRARKAAEATELWLRRLRDESYVEIHLEGAGER